MTSKYQHRSTVKHRQCPYCGVEQGHELDCPSIAGAEAFKKIGSVADRVFFTTGWICPRCGRGNSPLSSTCPCVPDNTR